MTLHRYESFAITFTRIMGLFWVLLSVLLLIILPIAWYDLFTGFPAALPTSDLIALSIATLFAITGGMVGINLFPDIIVRDDGLSVKCFFFKWFFVPWEDIIAVRVSLASVRKRIYLVQVRKLTLVHRLISLCQQGSLQPSFLITPSIYGYHELLRVIREHIDEAQKSE